MKNLLYIGFLHRRSMSLPMENQEYLEVFPATLPWRFSMCDTESVDYYSIIEPVEQS